MIPNFIPLPFFQANVETWFPARSGKRSESPYDLAPNCNRSVLSKLLASLADTPARSHFTVEQRVALDSSRCSTVFHSFGFRSSFKRISSKARPIDRTARVVARLVRFFPFRLVLGETRFDRDEEKRAMVISFDIGETLLRGKYVPFFSYATIMHDTRDLSRYSAVVISVYSNF